MSIVYKDRTFCVNGHNCEKDVNCYRRYTDRDLNNAEELGLPLAFMQPNCEAFNSEVEETKL